MFRNQASRSMPKTRTVIPNRLQPWIDARQRFHLSHAHVQMAFELGLNPKKFGKLANHQQEPWKLALPDFIVKLYFKRFGKTAPAHSGDRDHLFRRIAIRHSDRSRAVWRGCVRAPLDACADLSVRGPRQV